MRLPLGTSERRGGLIGGFVAGAALAIILGCAAWILTRPGPAPAPSPEPGGAGTAPMVDAIVSLSIADLDRILSAMSFNPETIPAAPAQTLPAGEERPVPTGPFLKVTRRGYTFFIRFFDCQDPTASTGCQTVEVVSGSFMLAPAPSASEIITWNRQSWWAFAVADQDGLPYLRSYFSTTGGVSEAFIRNFFQLWDWRVTKFAQFIKELADSREAGHE